MNYDFSAKNQCTYLKKIVAASSHGKKLATYFLNFLLASCGRK
jgi:hypothetical protein